MSFTDFVQHCAANRELFDQFDRLTGSNLSLRGAPIELAIDKATGKLADDCGRFVAFVYECIWSRVEKVSE